MSCRLFRIGLSVVAFALGCSAAIEASRGESKMGWDTLSDTWAGVDALGRVLPMHDDVGDPRPEHHTGIFYFVHTKDNDLIPRDLTQILKADPNALDKPNSPLCNAEGTPHFWGEPLFGFYSQRDPAVLRKHAQMLNDAGVDMLLFDTSNGLNYDASVNAIGDTFLAMRRLGMKTPQCAFHCVAKGGPSQIKQVRELFDAFYKSGKYDELWYRWEGKPLIIAGDDSSLPSEIRSYFTFRKAYWLGLNPGPGSWTLDGFYPREDPRQIQKTADGRVEQVSVATASSTLGHVMSSQFPGNSR